VTDGSGGHAHREGSRAVQVSVGVTLPVFKTPDSDWRQIEATARAADELGLDRLWVGDHLAGPAPNVEALVTLGYAAGVTRRARLCLGVLIPALRDPVWTIKQLQAADVLSRGRVELGVGVGGEFPREWEAAGVQRRDRGRRTDDFLASLSGLFGGISDTRLGGRCIPPLEPGSPQGMPPLWVGGRSDAAIRRAVQHAEGWMGIWMTTALVGRYRARLDDLAAAGGRLPPRLAVGVVACIDRDYEKAREATRRYVGTFDIPLDRVEARVAIGSETHVERRLLEFVDAGADTLAVSLAGVDLVGQIEALARMRERWVRGRPNPRH
jgi:alkanesulfonate monooxygenase SsuD/methylene tetrahydromethanopterin reductase-like flavin-dependent oxidoreductase (luciferase family)